MEEGKYFSVEEWGQFGGGKGNFIVCGGGNKNPRYGENCFKSPPSKDRREGLGILLKTSVRGGGGNFTVSSKIYFGKHCSNNKHYNFLKTIHKRI